MKLVVLAGAKKDASVPLKKDRFVIGRSKECSLRAGSDAISRKHCELARTDEGVRVRDLGSRNGTYVNDEKIEGPTLLSHGDTLKIGPLEFRYEAEGELNKAKQPKVASVSEAIDRAASKAGAANGGGTIEDSISDWLLGAPETEPKGLNETQSLDVEETRAISKQLTGGEETLEPLEEEDELDGEEADEEAEDDNKKKKEPGKLPIDALKPKTKDSREAAEQILRDMARRR